MARVLAGSTLRAYGSDWRHFDAWCVERGLDALPAAPETVALYITDMASWAKASTIQRRIISINQAHKAAGHEDSPTSSRLVRATHAEIRRTIGTAQVGKTAALTAVVRAMVATLDADRLIGIRDRALLLLGFAGAFRRSELVALDVADVAEQPEGLVVTIRRSRTDQEGAGRQIGVPYGSNPDTCPVRAVRTWLEASGIVDGPIFRPIDRHGRMADRRLSRSGRAVADTVKRYAGAVGLDPARYAGHSLRSGLATSAAEAGASERAIMAQTGHKSLPMMVRRRYVRPDSPFEANAVAEVGL